MAFALGSALSSVGCGTERPIIAVEDGSIPSMPTPMPGKAMLTGVVRDGAGMAVGGAKLWIAETDATATSDATGAYAIDVPSDSTVTLVGSADGFAKTYEESVMLGAGTAGSVDVRLLAPADITAKSAMAGVAAPDKRGVMAVRLRSTGAGCAAAGAQLTVYPPGAATVIYGRPGSAGGMAVPDATLASVQDGADVAAWLVAVVPPGNMLSLTIDQPHCALAAGPQTADGMMFTGQLRSDAGALTEASLFLAAAQ
jgi:hypothetical protein